MSKGVGRVGQKKQKNENDVINVTSRHEVDQSILRRDFRSIQVGVIQVASSQNSFDTLNDT